MTKANSGRVDVPACLRAVALNVILMMMAPHFATAAPVRDDLRAGERIFNRCRVCHTLEAAAPHGYGPNLHGLFGRPAGSRDGFVYSPAMSSLDITWTAETLDRFLTAPDDYVPGNRMSTVGIIKKSQRDALIEYLKAMTQAAPIRAGENR